MFELVEKKLFPIMDIEAQVYENKLFSCKHIHLKNNKNEKSFAVAFRTFPESSNGVAHILEHLVLSGSKRYPVRSSFSKMMNRSLSSFMNAMTGPDYTIYPFSTVNNKDFKNLLDVYLDAVFFPNLNELDFMQEGHRFELMKDSKGKEQLKINGVVYNEMKGLMSSVNTLLFRGLIESLLPNTTYSNNPGGDPEHIPELTYEELQKFHKVHYHPSNACFFSFGKVNLTMLQREIERKVLLKFSPQSDKVTERTQKPFDKPIYANKSYQPTPDNFNNYRIALGWVLNSSLKTADRFDASFLYRILMDNSSSPLQKVLETTNLGKSANAFIYPQIKYTLFIILIEGVKKGYEKKVEKLILETFKKILKKGIPKKLIDVVFHQYEIGIRQIFENGANSIEAIFPFILKGEKPLELIDLEGHLNKLKKRMQKSGYFETLIEKYFLKNNHRVNFQLIPDKNFNKKKLEKEAYFLTSKLSSLIESEKKEITEKTKALTKRQNIVDDENLLPCVTVKDIPKNRSFPKFFVSNVNDVIRYHYNTTTNGINTNETLYSIKNTNIEDLKNSYLIQNIINIVGINNSSYEEVALKRSEITGTFYLSLYPQHIDNKYNLYAQITGSCLERNFDKMRAHIKETITGFRLDETKRIKKEIEDNISYKDNLINEEAMNYAIASASSQLTLNGKLHDLFSGITSLNQLKSFKNKNGEVSLDKVLEQVINFKNKINVEPIAEVIVSNKNFKHKLKNNFKINLEIQNPIPSIKLNRDEPAWLTETEVNYCALAFPTVNHTHPDAPVLKVLGAILNNRLHSEVREKGGAYGVYVNNSAEDLKTFYFSSYRDPNIQKTFDAFHKSITWSLKSLTKDDLEEGILNIIKDIDAPLSPTGEALADYRYNILGDTQEFRNNYRQNVIECSIDRLVEVSNKYLLGDSKRAVVSSKKFEKELNSMGFTLGQL